MRIPKKGDAKYFDGVRRDQELVRLRKENEAFRSGEKYVAMQEEIDRLRRQQERELKSRDRAHEKELHEMQTEIRQLRKILTELTEDTLREIAALKKDAYREVDRLLAIIGKLESKVDRYREKSRQHAKEKYAAQTELQKQAEEAKRLARLMNQDHTNSNLPSSVSRNDPRKAKKIPNNRQKTDNSPGGQPGHPHHGRHWHENPNEIIVLPAEEFENNPLYRPTKEYIKKQVVGVRIVPYVVEYRAQVFRNTQTNGRVHAAFPAGLHDEVQYDETVKALCLNLTFGCNVAAEKVCTLLRDVSGGEIRVSHGFVTGLLKEFSEKTAPDRTVIYNALKDCDQAHIDTSFVSQSGRKYPVTVFANDTWAWFSATKHKGTEAADSTPAKESRAVLTHDEEATFKNYGTGHQDCLVHKCRRLQDAAENEPQHTWHTEMKSFLTSLLHWRKSWSDDVVPTPEEIALCREEYDRIVAKGEAEYENIPPAAWYTKAKTLLEKLRVNKEDILYFLEHPWIVPHNNFAEQLLRKLKLKDKQAVTFRSSEYVEYFGHFLTYTQTQLLQGRNMYDSLLEVFARPSVRPRFAPPASGQAA